ncbi:ATP-binding protein [Pelobacter propionicus]|uniref:Mg-protoporphyrin IX chelatase n=1 Tax=Pelobacter propionicus (strain DSM 2379 / NBRC 103807 / OttBd1) TaxID=338966 RepID=A1AQS1_PELPD|nr:ATP-binding protein [Pelobacter propionicus]ABK99691.1 protoporphyrin IX magnesium-chelatase [Pelobacter propionicus DSM 2379]
MHFPFTAIVGQEQLKTALILNVIDPGVGGLLVMGEKGTAKSTAVRALAELLPQLTVVRECRFHCQPDAELCSFCQERKKEAPLTLGQRKMRVVELPLGITEDRLIGTLDIEHAIKQGEKRFEPGLLADANRNFLYVDEVNLLEDHIIDLLLDSAAMGVNSVEREGISFSHPARFILVGTMNPEEGDLRPQLLDRFGLCVQVSGLHGKEQRMDILRRKAAFDSDATAFGVQWREQQEELAQRIVDARERLNSVELTDSALEKIVTITSALQLDGHRADIVIMKSARALAAYRGLPDVGSAEIRDGALLALPHRQKRLPFEELGSERGRLERVLEESLP